MSHPSDAELRQLAQTILAILDPAIQAAAALTSTAEREPGKCAQVWCPVCALGAVASGEQHPLLALIAEHGAGFVALIRTLADGGGSDSPTDAAPTKEGHAGSSGRYQPIPVTIHD